MSDLARYPFAEQDFLNEYYDGRWQPLPYVYNALKTLPQQHPTLWDASAVKNIPLHHRQALAEAGWTPTIGTTT